MTSRRVWACDRHLLDRVEPGVFADRRGFRQTHLDAVVAGGVVRGGKDCARQIEHTGGVIHHVGCTKTDIDHVDPVGHRPVAERSGEFLALGTHVVTDDDRGGAGRSDEAGEGTTDRLGSIGGELVGHRAADVVGLEDRIEIGHWSGSASGVMWGSVSSASSDMPIIGRPASIGRAFAARWG